MLGKLSRYLRMMGYSVIYTQESDDKILEMLDDCLLLTRDKHLCERAGWRCIYIASGNIKDQLAQLHLELGLDLRLPPRPSRCSICNSPLAYKGKVKDREIWVCPQCGQPYWYGSHVMRVEAVLGDISQKLRAISSAESPDLTRSSDTPLHSGHSGSSGSR